MPRTLAAPTDTQQRNHQPADFNEWLDDELVRSATAGAEDEQCDYIERLEKFCALVRHGAADAEVERCQRKIADLEKALTEVAAQEAAPRPGWLSFSAEGRSPEELAERGWLSSNDPAPGELPFGFARVNIAVEVARARSELAAAQQQREAASRELRALHDFKTRARARRIPADHARSYRSRASKCRTPRRRRTSAVVRATGDPDPEPDSGDARARPLSVGLIDVSISGGAP